MKFRKKATKDEVQEKQSVAPPQQAKVKRRFTFRFYMLIAGGIISTLGLVCFVIYFRTLNMMFGFPSIPLMGGGGFLLYFYWGKYEGITVAEFAGGTSKKQVNSMNLYASMVIQFEDMAKPEGFPWECINDGKMYFVNEWDVEHNQFAPFKLPDQQFMDPGEFAKRVLELPAHRKIFVRKPKLFEKLKTGLLVIAIGVVWLLILTTTG